MLRIMPYSWNLNCNTISCSHNKNVSYGMLSIRDGGGGGGGDTCAL